VAPHESSEKEIGNHQHDGRYAQNPTDHIFAHENSPVGFEGSYAASIGTIRLQALTLKRCRTSAQSTARKSIGMSGPVTRVVGLRGASGRYASNWSPAIVGSHTRVFGPVVHGEDIDASDLDLLIDPTPDTALMDLTGIQAAWEYLLGVKERSCQSRCRTARSQDRRREWTRPSWIGPCKRLPTPPSALSRQGYGNATYRRKPTCIPHSSHSSETRMLIFYTAL